MPIASTSMLETDKPFMFASSTGRPAPEADIAAPATTSKPQNDSSSSAAVAAAPALPRTSSALQQKTFAPSPAPPPSSNADHRPVQQPSSSSPSPSPSPFYHPHYQHHSHQHQHHPHHHQHTHHHHHSHHAAMPAPQEEDHYLYQHHQQVYERHDQETAGYTYRSTNSNHAIAGGMYSQRRPQQQRQQQHIHHHTAQYHVHHHIHPSHIPQQQQQPQQPQPQTAAPVMEEQQQHVHYPMNAAASSTTATTASNGVYLSEADDSEAWYEGPLDGAAESRRYKKRKDFSARIEKINMDFMDNKERIYADKLNSIQSEIKQVHNNSHLSYAEGVAELERIREKTIDNGRLFQQYQDQVTDKQYSREMLHAEEEYLAEKQEMREKLFATLEEKRRKLKDEKDNCELAYDVVMESQARMLKRNLRRRGLENAESKANKRKQLSGPALVFKLKEDDLQSDLHAMRIDSIPITNKKSTPTNKKK